MLTVDKRHHIIRKTNHRSLLNAAEHVFLAHGLGSTTMQQIADQAGLSRVTLYKHFTGKDELIFAIETRILTEFHEYGQARTRSDGSAWDKLQSKLLGYAEFFRAHKHHFRFVGLFDQHYANSYPDDDLAERYRLAITKFNHTEQLLHAGIHDGSLRPDIQPRETAAFIGNVFVATAQRVASREAILAREQQLDMNQLIDMFVTMVLQSLQHKE